MIDWDRVEILREEVGADGFDQIVAIFLDEVSEAIQQLEHCAPDKLEAALHFLKGSALNLGFFALAAACETGERLAASGQAERVKRARIVTLFNGSMAEFQEELGARIAS